MSKKYIIESAKNECFECGEETEARHHVVPRVLGGTKTIPLCQKCHDIVHSDRPVRRTSVSELTKEGLRKAKLRGVKFGNPRYEEALPKARKVQMSNADTFALTLAPSIRLFHQAGITSLTDIASGLNDQGLKTRRGGDWHPTSVKRLISRLEKMGKWGGGRR